MTDSKAAEGKRPVAFSYVRFSTLGQLKGDSLRRQVAKCEEYCNEAGLDLHPVSYRDLGVSAFRRTNIEKGALSSFIDGVKTGKIPKGSYLVIEQFDRMSRADINVALQLLLDLVSRGITVVTLEDKPTIWDSEAVKKVENLILAIVFMSRANNESVAKSDRLKSFWGERRKRAAATGQPLTSECPMWLRAAPDKKSFLIQEDRAESIRKVFEMRIGGFGISSIVTKANKEGWPAPGKPSVQKSGESDADFAMRRTESPVWHTSTVGRLLRNRSVLGEYQPCVYDGEQRVRVPSGPPVVGYYPAVIDETTFLRAQAKAQRSGRFPGRRDAALKNWLQGLLKCTCGQSFVRKNKDSVAQPEYARYYCVGRNRGTSSCPGASAKELEEAVLYVVSRVAPQFFEGTARMEALRARYDVLQVREASDAEACLKLAEAIRDRPRSSAPTLSKVLDEAESTLAKTTLERKKVEAEIAELSVDSDEIFENIVNAVRAVDSLEARAALREALSRVIVKIVVHQDAGLIHVFLRGSEDSPFWHPLRPDVLIPDLELGRMSEEEHARLFPEAYESSE